MKNLLLKVKSSKSFNKVSYVSIDLTTIKVEKNHYDNKDFDVKFNIELLDSEEVILDYGYGFTEIDLKDLKKEEDFYYFDIHIKGLDSEKFQSKLITVELTEEQKEVLDIFFNAKDKVHEKLLLLKGKAKSLFGKTKEEQEEFINSFKTSIKDIHTNIKKHTEQCCSSTKDFIDRAKNNDLSKKEKIISGVAIGLTAIALIAGIKTKK